MLSFLNQYAGNLKYSQNGEELLLFETLSRLGLRSGHAVEIGGADGRYCSNTALLLEGVWGWQWSGLYVEFDYNLYLKSKENWKNNLLVRHQCSRVDEKNINAFVDDSCDLLSLDTDGSDWSIFNGLLAHPAIVIIEIDSSYPPDYVGFNTDGAGTYRNTAELGISKGYFLLVHCGNLIFVDNKYRRLFPEAEGDGLSNSDLYFNRAWLK
jgi:hypothetical protein